MKQTFKATQFVRPRPLTEAEREELRAQRSEAKAQRQIDKLARGEGPLQSAPAPSGECFDTVRIDRIAAFQAEEFDRMTWAQLREEVRRNVFEIGVVRRQLSSVKDDLWEAERKLTGARSMERGLRREFDTALQELEGERAMGPARVRYSLNLQRRLYLTRAWCVAACLLAALLVYPTEPWRAVALCLAGVLGPFVPALLSWRRKGGDP